MKKLITLYTIASASVSQAAVVAQFDFTGGSIANTATPVTGVSGVTLTLGSGLGNLSDNGAPANSLRISGDDTQGTTSAAITNNAFITLSITIESGFTANFNTLTLNSQATNAFNYSFARVYSSIDGSDAVTADTIGVLGRQSPGSDAAAVNQTIDFNSGSYPGSNISDADFDDVTGTIVFTLPWIDDSNSDTRFTDLNSLSFDLDVTPVPEPSSTLLLGLGGLGLVLRRRK